tara:strand:+ start:27 stop:401 length:375 start_codon:yes stop_codon:yes gene_type:complete
MNNWWLLLKKYDETTYVVKDNVWNQAKGEGMDSIEDLERKLDRELTFDDFTDDPANWNPIVLDNYKTKYPEHYQLLMDRIGGESGIKRKAEEYLTREDYQGRKEKEEGKTPDNIEEAKKITGQI